MLIETERLVIRDLEHKDAEQLFKIVWQKNVVRFMKDWSEHGTSKEGFKGYIDWHQTQKDSTDVYDGKRYAITRKGEDILIGVVGMGLEDTVNEVEMAYFLDEECQGKGYATEALNALFDWCMQVSDLPYLILTIDCANEKSCKVAERAGFELFEKRTPIGHKQPNMRAIVIFIIGGIGSKMDRGSFKIEIIDEKINNIVRHIMNEEVKTIHQICERYGEEEEDVRHYDVYTVELPSGTKILKKVSEREVFNYESFFAGKELLVPHYYGKWVEDDEIWILIENIPGEDLRDMTDELALAAADTLSQIQNTYWQQNEEEFQAKKIDDRFEVYLKRIQKRAFFIENEVEIRQAYQLFLERQLTCPRTLSNGDFLEFNAINCKNRVYVIDWGFGGVMPYSLDIARFIAHATDERSTFPFYMNDRQKKIFCESMYKKLMYKPSYSQYLWDIKLAVLNEYVEFVEADEDESGWYYQHAVELAKEILVNSENISMQKCVKGV